MKGKIMQKEIKLPSGATVTLKDPSKLLIKDRKKIIKASDSVEGEMSSAIALGEALISVMVEEWSFDLLPPSVKADSLDALTPTDYDALQEACSEAQEFLFPKLSKTPEADADPKVVIDNSNDSNG